MISHIGREISACLAISLALWVAISAQSYSAENVRLSDAAISDGAVLFTDTYRSNGMYGVWSAVKDCYGKLGHGHSLKEATVCMAADTLGYTMDAQVSKKYRMPPMDIFISSAWSRRLSEALKRFPAVDQRKAVRQLLHDAPARLVTILEKAL